MKNYIGLNQKESEKLAKELNSLLANYKLFYMNVRGFHWNIKGNKFFELHEKFEELYNDLLNKVDEIAERILTLGAQPMHSYSAYLEHAEIKEAVGLTDEKSTVSSLLNSFQILLEKQRSIMELSDASSDEGTNALMSDYVREQEKLVWMYNAFLGENH